MTSQMPYVIGITGGSGSGKTSFTNKLVVNLSPDISVLTLDNYYFPIQDQPLDQNGKPNFDEPESLDLAKFQQDFYRLLKGEAIHLQEYTFNNPAITPKKIIIKPARIIVLEGLYVFHLSQVNSKIDLKVFIELDETEKVNRRLQRDIQERGYNKHDVLYSNVHHVTPAYKKHIERHKHDADLVIPNYPNFDKGLEVLTGYLKEFLNRPL